MYFRTIYLIKPWGIQEPPDPLCFELETPSVRVEARDLANREPSGVHDDYSWEFTTTTEECLSAKVDQYFLAGGDLPQGGVDVVTRVRNRMHEALHLFLSLTRWRTGTYGKSQLIRSSDPPIHWSVDGENWQRAKLPIVIGETSFEISSTRFDQRLHDEVVALQNAGHHEPLAQELLREAWNLRPGSPRSALTLAVSALEVGTKEFISQCVPDAEWLCFELPAPPVVRVLTDYVPRLVRTHGRQKDLSISSSALDDLKAAVFARNAIAHKGKAAEPESVRKSIELIQTMLYYFDVQLGRSWAARYFHRPDAIERSKD